MQAIYSLVIVISGVLYCRFCSSYRYDAERTEWLNVDIPIYYPKCESKLFYFYHVKSTPDLLVVSRVR